MVISMLARRLRAISAVGFLAALALFTAACEKVPLMAPSGSTIRLNAATTVLSANGSTTIIAQVLEAAGTPPHSGTRITFTTTLGRVDPPNVETDAAGQAIVTFVANGANGTAIVGASSGGATTGTDGALRLSVGSAAVGRISLNATNNPLPSAGGVTTVSAVVLDVNGNALSGTPIAFSTTAGTLSTSLVATDNNGIATTVLSTSQAATVTGTVGVSSTGTPTTPTTPSTPVVSGTQSASIQIAVAAAPLISITPPSTSPSKGLPGQFTFVVTPAAQNGSAIRSVVVNWGDGTVDSLGSVSGSQTAFHVFKSDGTFTVTATVTDAAGSTNTASTSIVVIPVPRPTILVNSSPVPAKVNTQTTVLIQITVPTGIGITETVVNFGDGTSANLGGAASASPTHVYTSQGTFTVTVTVTDTSGQTTIGTTSVSVGP